MSETTHRWTSVLEADIDAEHDPLAPRHVESPETFSDLYGGAVQREGDAFAEDVDELDVLDQLRGARRRLYRVLSGGAGTLDAVDDL